MASILVPIANGFEEIEAISIIDICRRANIEVTIAAIENITIIGAHNIKIEADCMIDEINENSFDMIVLPGGLPNAYTLADNKKVQTLLQSFKNKDKKIAAICAAPYALYKAGVLSENYTCYPSFENKIRLDGYQSDISEVITDGNITTSRGPGTAMSFALELVKILKGNEVFQNIKKGVLA